MRCNFIYFINVHHLPCIAFVLRLAIKSFSAQKPHFLQAIPQKIRAV